MRFTRFVKRQDVEKLELEVISQDLRVYLTRLLESRIPLEVEVRIAWQNRFINRSRSLAGLPAYILEGDDWGLFHPAEYAWHIGEFEIIFRRLDTVQFIELFSELIEADFFELDEINELLEQEHLSFRFGKNSNDKIVVDVFAIEDIVSEPKKDSHPNIRVLAQRMDTALDQQDYAGVLHASASIFETMAKDIVAIPTVQNQTLRAFFDRYRKDSTLPTEILDYILAIYESRNITPLAGHGSTQTPAISREGAITLCEMTKAFVRIEYRLHAEIRAKS